GKRSPAGTRSGKARCSTPPGGSSRGPSRLQKRGLTCRGRWSCSSTVRFQSIRPGGPRRRSSAPRSGRPDTAASAAGERCPRSRHQRPGASRPQLPPAPSRPSPCPAARPPGLGALAAAVTPLRERLGLVVALAVPVLPLGNLSAGLAWAYAAVALGWIALTWKDARTGLFFIVGPLLAPLSLLGLL